MIMTISYYVSDIVLVILLNNSLNLFMYICKHIRKKNTDSFFFFLDLWKALENLIKMWASSVGKCTMPQFINPEIVSQISQLLNRSEDFCKVYDTQIW